MFCAYMRPRYQVSVYRTIGTLVFKKCFIFYFKIHQSFNNFPCNFLGSSITKPPPPRTTHQTRHFSPFSLSKRRNVSKLRHIKIDVMHVIFLMKLFLCLPEDGRLDDAITSPLAFSE